MDESTSVASDAEEHLVTALLLHPDAISRIGRLVADDFFNPRHRVAFEALQRLHDRGEPVDVMTLQAEIHKSGMLEAIGGPAGVSKYLLVYPVIENVPQYVAIVRDQSFDRRLRIATDSASSRLSAGASWRAELAGLRTALESLEEESSDEPPTLRAVIGTELESIRSGVVEVVGLPTGLGIERVCPTGIPLDKVTTLFGETGNFKTTLASNLAWNIASHGNAVLNISWEDSNQLSAQRAIGRSTGISYGRLAARKLDAGEKSRLAVGPDDEQIAERIIMADTVEPTIDAVVRLARYYKRARGVKAVIIDYIQLITGAGTQKQILDHAIQTAQHSAKRDQIAYIFVSQVKAEVTHRKKDEGGPRPTLDDCLGSSAMRIGTKLGLGVFRPSKYCKIPDAKGDYTAYSALAAKWPTGKERFLADVYPRILEINVTKNVMGVAPATLLCLVELETGLIEPFGTGAV